MPEPLTAIFDPTSINLSKEELTQLADKLCNDYVATNSQSCYDQLFEITKEQSVAPSWMIHRAGRVTASVCFRVAKMQNSKSLIKSIMQYKPAFVSKYTEYGKSMENKGKFAFVSEHKDRHQDFICSESGLVVSAETPFLGATPDGLVSCSCYGKAVLELKCPFTCKNGFEGWQEDTNFPLDKDFNMKQHHLYYYQIQLQIDLCGVDFGYFYVYSPAEKAGLSCIVQRNAEFISTLKTKLMQNSRHSCCLT